MLVFILLFSAFNLALGNESFLDTQEKYYKNLDYSISKKIYLHKKKFPLDWGGLNHEPLKNISEKDLNWIDSFKNFQSDSNNQRLNSTFHQSLDEISGSELTTGNQFTPFEDGDVLPTLLKLISKTEHTLWGSALLYSCDEDTKPITEALAEKARSGVDVRLMIDWGLQKLQKGKCLHYLKKSGVKVYHVRGIAHHNSAFHVKLWMSDFKEGIFLGANLIDVQTRSTGFNHLYHDSGTSVTGPAATDMAERFLELWQIYHNNPTELDLASLENIQKLKAEERKKKLRGVENYSTWLNQKANLCRVVTQERHLGRDRVSKTLHEYLKTAQKRIWLASVRRDFHNVENIKLGKNKLMMEIFHKAIKENVKVEMIYNTSATPFTPSTIPNTGIEHVGKQSLINRALVISANASAHHSILDGARYYQEARKKTSNIRAWSYFTFNHNKNVIIDDDFVMTGSYNPLSERSTNDAEISIFCQDPSLNSIYSLHMARDLVNSIHYPLASQIVD